MSGTTPAFRTGAEEAKKASKGAAFARTQFFGLEDKGVAYIRLISDVEGIITVQQHQMIPTKGAPKGHSGNWPEKMGAVCRNDIAFTGMYEDCFICENKLDRAPNGKPRSPGARNWMFACLREPVYGEVQKGGKTVKVIEGYRNVKRKVAVIGSDGKPTAEETEELAVVVINLGHKNFTSILLGFGAEYETLLDRDYKVTREGTDKETIYHIIPMDAIEVEDSAGNEVVFDLREPEFLQRYGFASQEEVFEALSALVAERSSDEYYGRFFDTRVEVSSDGDVKASTTPQTPAPSNDVDADRLKELKARVKGFKAKDASSPDGDADDPVEESVPEPEHASADVPAPPKTPAKAGRAKARNFD